jgi:hypothetical protein
MVPFKNATVTATPLVQEQIATGEFDNPELGSPQTGILVYLEEWDAMEVYMDYGVKLVSPAIIQVDPANAQYFSNGTEVTVTSSGYYNGRVYKVHGRGDIHADGLQSDHASYLADRMQDAI